MERESPGLITPPGFSGTHGARARVALRCSEKNTRPSKGNEKRPPPGGVPPERRVIREAVVSLPARPARAWHPWFGANLGRIGAGVQADWPGRLGRDGREGGSSVLATRKARMESKPASRRKGWRVPPAQNG